MAHLQSSMRLTMIYKQILYLTQRRISSGSSHFKGVFLSVNPKTDFRSKKGFRVPFGKSKSGFLIW